MIVELLLACLLILSSLRVLLMLWDRGRIREMNVRTEKMNVRTEEQHKQWMAETASTRKAEIAELAEMAKGSDALRQILSEIEAEGRTSREGE